MKMLQFIMMVRLCLYEVDTSIKCFMETLMNTAFQPRSRTSIASSVGNQRLLKAVSSSSRKFISKSSLGSRSQSKHISYKRGVSFQYIRKTSGNFKRTVNSPLPELATANLTYL